MSNQRRNGRGGGNQHGGRGASDPMVTMKFTLASFSPRAVQRSMDPVKKDALTHAGASVRKRARQSIRRRKGTSKPGEPPRSHVGTLKRLIYYGWDPASESVVVGPLRFGEGGAPALEYGGLARIKINRGDKAVRVRARVRARPFMGPAKKQVEPLMAGFWRQAALKQRRS